MSRWWTDPPWSTRLRVGLAPAELLIARRARGFPRHSETLERLGLTPDAGTAPWQAALAALRGVLAGCAAATRVEAVLSQRFTRHALLPWSAQLRGDAEWRAFAEHSFRSTHGVAAADWEFSIARESRGMPRLACAADRTLLAGLREVCASAKANLASVQPYLACAYNRAREGFKEEDLWLALGEEGRLTLGLLQNKRWTLLRTRALAGEDSIEDLLRREAALAGIDPQGKIVYVGAPPPRPASVSSGRIIDRTLRAGAALDSRPFAMVLT